MDSGSQGKEGNVFLLVIYGLTGIFSTILLQRFSYEGALHPLSMLGSFPVYFGSYLVGVFSQRLDLAVGVPSAPVEAASLAADEPLREGEARSLVGISVLDLMGNVMSIVGIGLAGSAMYQVSFSFIVVASAVAARVFLGRKSTSLQWLSLAGITFGLLFRAFIKDEEGASSDAASAAAELEASAAGGAAAGALSGESLGIVASVGSTLCYASSYVVSDGLIASGITPGQLSTYLGLVGSASTSVWIAAYTLPRWNSVVADGLAEAGGSPSRAVVLFFSLLAVNIVANHAHFALIRSSGPVVVGVMQAVRAAGVFAASHILFCSEHEGQCLTASSALSAIFVILGVIAYALASRAAGQQNSDGASGPASELPVLEEGSAGAREQQALKNTLDRLAS